jgi:cellobiose phosphorylase
MIAGKDAATHGEAKNSWLTGTAAWNYVAITQYLLGIRPGFDGLEVKPVLPSDWKDFEAVRSFRGVRYEISVKREGPGNEVSLEVDGQPIESTVIPLPDAPLTGQDIKTVKVKAIVR